MHNRDAAFLNPLFWLYLEQILVLSDNPLFRQLFVEYYLACIVCGALFPLFL